MLYSQIFNNLPLYNPATVGCNENMNVCVSYRSQWPKLPQKFTSENLYVNKGLFGKKDPKVGFGLIVQNQKSGISALTTTHIGGSFSKGVKINKYIYSTVGISILGGYETTDFSNLVFPDQLDPAAGNIYPTSYSGYTDKRFFLQADGGVMLQIFDRKGYRRGEIGGAVRRFAITGNGFSGGNMKEGKQPYGYNLHGEIVFPFNYLRNRFVKYETPLLIPGFYLNNAHLRRSENLGTTSCIAGANLMTDDYLIGIWLKKTFYPEIHDLGNRPDFVLVGGFKYSLSSTLVTKLSYSHDFQNRKALGNLGGADEVHICVELGKRTKTRKPSDLRW